MLPCTSFALIARVFRCQRHVLLAVLASGLAAAVSPSTCAAVTFTNATAAAGISYALPDPIPPLGDNAVSVSGGAAAGDFDNDGWTDLFVTRYWDSPILYRNNRDGTFSDVTSSVFAGGTPGAKSNGATWADIDNDGDADLYVPHILNAAGNRLYINNGAGQLVEDSHTRGTNFGGVNVASMSSSFGDYDNDGYLDLYVTEWRGASGYTTAPTQARLLRNRGAAQPGYFDDVTAQSGAAMGPLQGAPVYQSNSFTPRFADFDRDGRLDLFINSDFGTSRLFWNNGDGTFTDGTGPIDGQLGLSDMGLAIGDVDGNGLLDIFTTDICHAVDCATVSGNRLFRNFGNRQFLESSNFAGVRNAGWGWGTQMLDYDNDRDLDIMATNGYYAGPTVPVGFENDAIRLFNNNGQGGLATTFTDVAAAVSATDTSQGRGLLTFDYDRDGDQDVFIVNNFQAPVLYRNDGGNAGNWLQIEPTGVLSNFDGVGAFITVIPDLGQPNKKLVHEVSGSSSFLSQSEAIAHFGLGPHADPIDLVRIEWPASGIVQEFHNVAPNQRLVVVERYPADFDSDLDVDGSDFLAWQRGAGGSGGAMAGDANGDGVVDAGDFALWQASFGTSGAESASLAASIATPEPATAVLAACGVLGAIACMRRDSDRPERSARNAG